MAESAETKSGSVGVGVEARVGELLNAYLDRRARGELISEEVLLAEHPDVADVLAQHLSMLRALAPSPNVIKELLAKKVLSPSGSPDYSAELGNYRITGVIGRGGMGIVLRAIEVPLNRLVALKILRPELAVDRRALIRFEHEAQAAAALRHPNIVTVYACGECDGTHFLAMELIDGPSLADLLARESEMPTDEIRRIFGELLQGLAAAHAAELIHRDIKSSNILLDGPSRQVKIADFGLARITASNTRVTMPQSAIGTPEYMSPEQARGDENVDCRTDLYSAGVVLYEMLTGRVPFKGDSPSALIHAILTTDPPTPCALRKSADKHVSRLALRLMAKRPEDRFARTVDALTALEQGRGVRLRWSNRFRRRLLGAASLLAGAASILLAWSVLFPEPLLKEVKIETRDEKNTTTVLAKWEGDTEFHEFYTFPRSAEFVQTATLVDRGPYLEPIVLASTKVPLDGKSLFAFHPGWVRNTTHKPFWSESLFRQYEWPDATVTDFVAQSILAGNYDGLAGEEVVLVVTDQNQYPSYLALFDPQTLTIGAEYWHVGKFGAVLIAPDFLGRGRPAIIATAMNNKLDGFRESEEGDPNPVASFDWVPSLMILDMQAMSGKHLINIPNAPKRMPPLPAVLPYAYAFLDAALSAQVPHIDPATREFRDPKTDDASGEIMAFDVPSVVSCAGKAESGWCIQVDILRRKEPDVVGAVFLLDSDLEVSSFDPLADERAFRTVDPWLERFKRLVVRGQYVGPSQ